MLSLRHVGPGSLDPLGRVGAEQSGAAKHGFGAATLSATGDQPCRFSFIDFRALNLVLALIAAVQRLLAAAAPRSGYRVSFATARSHQLAAEGSGHAFSPACRPWFS